ncbi:ferrienterobactin-binding periplasmic protein precursor [Roseomonas sp. TAS13]|uniref:ABC transporter substrate-binding protein n=1 Tax=Roseomonas sp. TAS13 TaxID=1926319 RepID=UPI00095B5B86|nr:ABC transporter substrate-binding protein [Roseomonas sp. TAS13]USQ71087.1 ABC transporter substrate-binding protein [Roseomonas mucosa]GAV35851.1 ferrienterobactin-binding periplasmic protein precursor [Roseomonas sp. TAS13]
MALVSSRLRLVLPLLPLLPWLAPPAQAQAGAQDGGWPRRVTDLAGREVTLPRQPRALLLAENFQLLTLSVLMPDPVSLLVGMGGDLKQHDQGSDLAFRRRFPAMNRVPELTSAVGQGFSVERALTLRPDLVVLSTWQLGSAETRQNVEHLAAAGIPVVFIDNFQRPLSNGIPSIRLLGRALGCEERAEAVIGFQEERLARIRERVAVHAGPKPGVIMNAFAGRRPCCWVAGNDGTGQMLSLVGVRNLSEGMLPGPRGGEINLEQLLAVSPEIVVNTGNRHDEDQQGLRVGTGVTLAEARASLEALMASPELVALPATRDRRVYGLWNPVFGSPVGIAALEAMARWLRPDLFADLDPAATLAEINRRFAAVPFEGTYWVGPG